MNKRMKPVVFVSSTCYDLKQVREDMKAFLEENYGFQAMLSEFDSFPIDPCIGTFENCLSNVDNYAYAFVLIVGTRYGYVTDKGKSITNLEYLHAKAKGIPIYVFVSKQLYSTLPLWRNNKTADFSSVVDDPRIFEFVSEIYDSSQQWVYTYESVRDIILTLKQQFGLIFADGLVHKKVMSSAQYPILNYNLPSGAIRMVVEKPFLWEYKFLAYVMKGEFDRLQKYRWDYKYGFSSGPVYCREPRELVDDLSNKMSEMLKISDNLSVILNTAIQDAIGEPGVPSNLEMMVYISKQFASMYERIVSWGLYFKTIHADEIFSRLLQLMFELPKTLLERLDDFVERLYTEITSLPDVEDNIVREVKLTCDLSGIETEGITEEIQHIYELIHSYN